MPEKVFGKTDRRAPDCFTKSNGKAIIQARKKVWRKHPHADGTTHTHTHAHAHDHENEHTHSHEECAHTHCDACDACEHSPKEELMALMKYMVGHNASHANELANLAKQLQEMGETAAYDQIMLAVSDFEKGNLRLSTVLASMQAPNA